MNYYRLNDLYVCKALPVLIDTSGLEIDLELKAWRLILLFCQCPNKIISRDEIIEGAYDGVIVSDNAVNKMVAKVRKVLNDEPSKHRFIKTIPKQGYCFIADTEEVDKVPSIHKQGKVQRIRALFACLTSLLLIVLGYFLFYSNNQQNEYFVNTKLSPLTRNIGVEFAPHLSPGGEYLVYQKSSPQDSTYEWWIKGTESNMEVNERRLPIKFLNASIAWSSQATSFLYIEREDNCQVHKMLVTPMSQTTNHVMDCGDNWISDLVYAADDIGFFYIARKEIDEPSRVYFYSLEEKQTIAINQPQTSGIGNYAIDLSPDKEKLLILSAESDSRTELFELTLGNNELIHKGNRDWLLNRAIWHHDNERIIQTSQRYARELLVTNFAGKPMSTLVSNTQRVAANFKRHPNNIDFYFTSFQMNNDLARYANGVENKGYLDNSDVYEKLPIYPNSMTSWYFVSNRMGISQIFLSTESSVTSTQVSNFEKEHEFVSLDASPNGEQLAFHDSKYLIVLDPTSGKYAQYETPMGNILASSWLNNSQISLSLSTGTNRVVLVFDVHKHSFEEVSPRWLAVFSDQGANKVYAVEAQTSNVYQLDHRYEPLELIPIKIENLINYAGLQVKVTNETMVFSRVQGLHTELVSYNLTDHSIKTLGKWLYIAGFDVFEQQLILSFEKNRTGDVMRTHLQ